MLLSILVAVFYLFSFLYTKRIGVPWFHGTPMPVLASGGFYCIFAQFCYYCLNNY